MAKGKKYDPEIKERAIALLAVYDSVSKVAKELNLPWSTVDTWKKEKSDEGGGFEKLREQKKEEFIQNAWSCVMKSQGLIMKRLERAERSEAAIDELIDEVESDSDLSYPERKALITKLAVIKLDDVSKLGVIMGTMYDKYALAANEPTVNHGGVVRFEEL